MGRTSKKNTSSKKKSSKKKACTSPIQSIQTIDSTGIKDFFNAAGIMIASHRNASITTFLDDYAINKICSTTLENIIKCLESDYPLNEQHYELTSLNIWHSTITKLLPLSNASATYNTRKKLLGTFFHALSLELDLMVKSYHYQKGLFGEQFFYHLEYLKEKINWFTEFFSEALEIYVERLNKGDLVNSSGQLFSVFSTYISLMSFSQYHPSFSSQHDILMTQMQKTLKRKGISNIIDNFHNLPLKETFAIVKECPPPSANGILWQTFFEKTHSLYRTFDPWVSEMYSEEISLESPSIEDINEKINLLKNIYKNLPHNDILNKESHTLNSCFDALIAYRRQSENEYSESHYELCKEIYKIFVKIGHSTTDDTALMHHIICEILNGIMNKLIQIPKDLFDIKEFINIAKTLDITERQDKTNSFLKKYQDTNFDEKMLSKIIYEIRKYLSKYYNATSSMTLNSHGVEGANLWYTILEKLLSRSAKTNGNLEETLVSYSFFWTLFALKRIIEDYVAMAHELDPLQHGLYVENLKEKLKWYDEYLSKYFDIQVKNITSKQQSKIKNGWDNLKEMCSFYVGICNFYDYFFLPTEKVSTIRNDVWHFKDFILTHKKSIKDNEFLDKIDSLVCATQKNNVLSPWANLYEDVYFKVNDIYKNLNANVTTSNRGGRSFNRTNEIALDQHIKRLNQASIEEKNIANLTEEIISALNILSEVIGTNHKEYPISKYKILCNEVLKLIEKIHYKNVGNNLPSESYEDLIYKMISVSLKEIHQHLDTYELKNIEYLSAEISKITLAEDSLKPQELISELDEIKKNEKEISMLSKEYEMEFSTIKNEIQHNDEQAQKNHQALIEKMKQDHQLRLQALSEHSESYRRANELELKALEEKLQREEEEATKQHQILIEEMTKSHQLCIQSLHESSNLHRKEINQSHQHKIESLNKTHAAHLKELETKLKKDKRELKAKLSSKEKELSDKLEFSKIQKSQKINKKIEDLTELNKSKIHDLEIDFQNQVKKIKEEFNERYQQELFSLEQKFNDEKVRLEESHSKQYAHTYAELLKEYNRRIESKTIQFNQQLDSIKSKNTNELYSVHNAFQDTFQKIDSLKETRSSLRGAHFISNLSVPPHISSVMYGLHMHNIEAYIVGGWVRNKLLQIEDNNEDFDIVINAHPEQVLSILGSSVIQAYPQKKLVRLSGIDFWCEPWGNNLALALSRRDFTINALTCDYLGNVYDLLGVYPHIYNNYLVVLGNSYERFKIDSSLILRCIRFSVALNKLISPHDWGAIYQNAALISRLPIGIYFKNIARIFFEGNTLGCFSLMFQSNLLHFVFPFLKPEDILTDGVLYNFITTKLEALKETYLNDGTRDSKSVLALMMLIPIFKHKIEKNDIANFIRNRLEGWSLVGLLQADIESMYKALCSYCSSPHGYINEFMQFSSSRPESLDSNMNQEAYFTSNYDRQRQQSQRNSGNHSFSKRKHRL